MSDDAVSRLFALAYCSTVSIERSSENKHALKPRTYCLSDPLAMVMFLEIFERGPLRMQVDWEIDFVEGEVRLRSGKEGIRYHALNAS